jgi:hypothetical protein
MGGSGENPLAPGELSYRIWWSYCGDHASHPDLVVSAQYGTLGSTEAHRPSNGLPAARLETNPLDADPCGAYKHYAECLHRMR